MRVITAVGLAGVLWLLCEIVYRLKKSRRFVWAAISERKVSGMDIIKVKITLPVSDTPDVVAQELKLVRDVAIVGVDAATGEQVNIPAEETLQLGATQTEVEIEVAQDTGITLSLSARDDANNLSEPVTDAFIATDTIPPKLEGGFALTAVSERVVSTTTETPTEPVAETPVETPGIETPVEEGPAPSEPTEPTVG